MSKRDLSFEQRFERIEQGYERMANLFEKVKERGNWRITWTVVGFFVFASTFIWLCSTMTSEGPTEQLQGRILNFIVLMVGSVTGWLLGILISPYGEDEKTLFSNYAKVVSAFFSGYLLSKVDPIIGAIFDKNLVLQPVAGFRFGVFIGSLILFLIFTFATRQYGREMTIISEAGRNAPRERERADTEL
jgi:hypothetical protein